MEFWPFKIKSLLVTWLTWRLRWCTSIYKLPSPLKKLHWPPGYSYWREYHLFRRKTHLSPRTLHGCSWQEEISFSSFRVDGIQNSSSWERVVTRFPFKLSFPSLVPQRIHPEAGVWGKGKYEGLLLHKDGGLGAKWSKAQGHHAKGLSRRQPQNWESCVFCFLK